MTPIPEIQIEQLAERYSALLFDAFGVLVDLKSALPGARALIEKLNAERHPYLIVTNDASQVPASISQRLHNLGLAVSADRIVTSGSLLREYFEKHHLDQAACLVLGPTDAEQYVREAGGRIVSFDAAIDAVIVCDEAGFDFLDGIDNTLTALFRSFDAGLTPHLIQPNPDLIYPKGDGAYGFTAGAITQILESALLQRYPGRNDARFVRLGKPHPWIFSEAIQRAGVPKEQLVMIGDQPHTDIRGARAMGIDTALVTWGLTTSFDLAEADRPTYLLPSL